MNPTLTPEMKEIHERQEKALADFEAIRKEWKGKEATMPPEIEEKADKCLADLESIRKAITRQERYESEKSYLREPADEPTITGKNVDPADTVRVLESDFKALGFDSPEIRERCMPFMNPDLKSVSRKVLLGDTLGRGWTEAEHKAMQAAIALKAQSAVSDTAGGYLVMPMQLMNELITRVKDKCWVRGLSRNIPTIGAQSLGVPTLDTDLSDADWTAEITEVNEDSIGLGRRQLQPRFLSKMAKVSKFLLRQAALDPEAIVADRAAYKFAITEEKAFLTGDGNEKPLGVFTANANGIDASRDLSSITGGTLKPDDIINLYGSLKPAYRPNASFIYHRNVVTAIRKMKDNVGNYIWTPYDFQGRALTGNYPGLILGRPYYESEYAPDATRGGGAMNSGDYYGIFGDFSWYWIATNLMLDVQVLIEKFATTNQLGYIFRMEVDAMPTLAEAFSRGKIQ